METSSSEDEILQNALKEATDHQLLKDSYFCNAKTETTVIPDTSIKHGSSTENRNITNVVSLRKNLEETEKFSNFGVSSSFQNYVAKKLDEIIGKSIRIKKNGRNSVIAEAENENNNSGVKLLSSSTEFLIIEKESEKFPSLRKRKLDTVVDDEANLLKCKEVAVDPEWILSKAETKVWSNKRKEPEFKYKKLKNGTLTEIIKH